MSASRANILLYLLRRDLRITDNPILHHLATTQHSFTHLLPVYILPPHQIEVSGFVKDPLSNPPPMPSDATTAHPFVGGGGGRGGPGGNNSYHTNAHGGGPDHNGGGGGGHEHHHGGGGGGHNHALGHHAGGTTIVYGTATQHHHPRRTEYRGAGHGGYSHRDKSAIHETVYPIGYPPSSYHPAAYAGFFHAPPQPVFNHGGVGRNGGPLGTWGYYSYECHGNVAGTPTYGYHTNPMGFGGHDLSGGMYFGS